MSYERDMERAAEIEAEQRAAAAFLQCEDCGLDQFGSLDHLRQHTDYTGCVDRRTMPSIPPGFVQNPPATVCARCQQALHQVTTPPLQRARAVLLGPHYDTVWVLIDPWCNDPRVEGCYVDEFDGKRQHHDPRTLDSVEAVAAWLEGAL